MITKAATLEQINILYKNKSLDKQGDEKLRENDIYIFKNESQSAVARVKNQRYELLKDIKFGKDFKALNMEQNVFMNYLRDDEIKCVVCTGDAGTGKTIITMAFAYDAMMNGTYQNVIISRPPVSPSRKFDTGFKPGTLDEKMKPWLQIFYDNIG